VPYPYPESRGYSDVRGSYDGGRGYGDGAPRGAAASQPTTTVTTATTTTTYPDAPTAPQTQSRNPYPTPGPSGSNPYPVGQGSSQGYSDSVRSYPTSSDTKQHSLTSHAPYPDGRPYSSGVGSMGGSNGSGGYPYAYHAPVEEETMWGASLSQPEWVRFLDVMQRPPGERG